MTAFALAIFITRSALAQVGSSRFDPAPTLKQLLADPDQAAAICDKVSANDIPALLAAVNPPDFHPLTDDPFSVALTTLSRKAHEARLAADRAAEVEWDARTGLAIYQASGKHSPAWDAVAIDALKNNALPPLESYQKCKAAVDAGCNDPLIRYYMVRRGVSAGTITSLAAIPLFQALVPDLDNSPYTPARKFQVRVQLLRCCLEQKPAIRYYPISLMAYSTAINELPNLPTEHPSPLLARQGIEFLQTAGAQLNRPASTVFDQLHPHIAPLFPAQAFPYAFAARYYIDWAWEARGGDYGSKVTEQQFKFFDERLVLAEKSATAGATIDRLDDDCPARMITICMGRSYERPIMEKWFARAMLANPDNLLACKAKLTYLLPQWFGNPTDALLFGQQCAKYGSTESRLPTILLDAHSALANVLADKDAYYAQPAVWPDIDSVYKKLLDEPKRRTSDHANWLFDRAKYVHYAYDCHQWQTVIDLENQFKDEVDITVFGSKAVYNFYKTKATQQLAKTPI